MKCLHIESEGKIKGQKLPYRAHFKVYDSKGIEEKVDSIFIEFDHDSLSSIADAALHRMSAAEEQTLNQTLAYEASSIFMMKRLRGELIDTGEDS